MRASGFKNRFTSGEISPTAWERTDLEHHGAGCELGQNMVAAPTGPLQSRGAFLDRGAAKFGDKLTRVIPFIRAVDDALLLEFGDNYFRVWTATGNRLLDGGVQVEVVTGISAAELVKMRFRQVGDVLFLTFSDGGAMPYTLVRHANNDWAFVFPTVRAGPFRGENQVKANTLEFGAATGSVSMVASFDLFQSGHVNSVWRIRENDGNPSVRSWAPSTAYVTGDHVLSDGKVYAMESPDGTSGNTPPLHDHGDAADGVLSWQFLHDGAGIVQITAVTDARNAVCSIINDDPSTGVLPTLGPTPYWSEGAWSGVQGYPSAWPELFEERLFMAAPSSQQNRIDATRTDGFTPAFYDFKPGLGTGRIVDDDALSRGLDGQSGKIAWLLATTFLCAGTGAAIYVLFGPAIDAPMAPDGFQARELPGPGTADIQPIKAFSSLLYVARGGVSLRELRMDRLQATQGRDLSIVADHICERGIVEMAWVQPENVVWALLADGGLAAFSYQVEEGVMGWTRQDLGGWTVESLCSLPGEGGRDFLWMTAVRAKGGGQRRLWRLEPRSYCTSNGVWMNGAQQYLGGATDTVPVGAFAEGDTVWVMANWARVPDQVVTGGNVTVPAGSTNVWVGYPMTRYFRSLPLDLMGPDTTLGKNQKLVGGVAILGCVDATTVGVEIEDTPEDGPYDPPEQICTRRPKDTVPVLRRVKKKIGFNGAADRDQRVIIKCEGPWDLTIYGVRAWGEVNE